MERRVDPIEQRNDDYHRRVAAQIRRDPGVIAQALARLNSWIARDGAEPLPVRLEWRTALALLEPSQLADFLESTTPRARRMRISSPFFGLDP